MQRLFYVSIPDAQDDKESIQRLITLAQKYRGTIENNNISQFIEKVQDAKTCQEACENFISILRQRADIERNRNVERTIDITCEDPNTELCLILGVYAISGMVAGFALAVTTGCVQHLLYGTNALAFDEALSLIPPMGVGACGGGMLGIFENMDDRYNLRMQLKDDIEEINSFLKKMAPRAQMMR